MIVLFLILMVQVIQMILLASQIRNLRVIKKRYNFMVKEAKENRKEMRKDIDDIKKKLDKC